MAINWLRGIRRIGWVVTTLVALIGTLWATDKFMEGIVSVSPLDWLLVAAVAFALCFAVAALVVQGAISTIAWVARGFEAADTKIEFQESSTGQSQGSVIVADQVVSPTPDPKLKRTRRWVLIYGWLLLLLAAFVFLTGVLSLLTSESVTPSLRPFGKYDPMPPVSALLQGLLWGITGWAIIKAKKYAVRLVWAIVIMSAVGTLARRLVPLDILVWILTLWFAIWYSKSVRSLTAFKIDDRR